MFLLFDFVFEKLFVLFKIVIFDEFYVLVMFKCGDLFVFGLVRLCWFVFEMCIIGLLVIVVELEDLRVYLVG